MYERKDAKIMERRGFFKMIGHRALPGDAPLAKAPSESEENTDKEASGNGYRETELVKKYYDLAKF